MAATKKEFNLDYPYNMLCDIFGVRFPSDIEITHDMVIDACRLSEGPDFIASVNYIVSILPGRCPEALELRYLRHMTGKDISSIMDVTTSRALQLCDKGLRILRKPDYIKYIKHGGISNLVTLCLTWRSGQLHAEDDHLDLYALGLSVRTYNCLRRAGYNNVEDITNSNIYDLLEIRNMGKKGVIEIVDSLSRLGLKIIDATDEDIEYLKSAE